MSHPQCRTTNCKKRKEICCPYYIDPLYVTCVQSARDESAVALYSFNIDRDREKEREEIVPTEFTAFNQINRCNDNTEFDHEFCA